MTGLRQFYIETLLRLEELLKKEESVTIRQTNLQILARERLKLD